MTTPYTTLSLPEDASEATIRSTYRRLALTAHPDKNPNPKAASTFRIINAAYNILSDPSLRASWDNAEGTAHAQFKRVCETEGVPFKSAEIKKVKREKRMRKEERKQQKWNSPTNPFQWQAHAEADFEPKASWGPAAVTVDIPDDHPFAKRHAPGVGKPRGNGPMSQEEKWAAREERKREEKKRKKKERKNKQEGK